MNSILITGCNRGLGLGLVKHLLKEANPPKHVIATCRNIEKATELKSISQDHGNVHILELDVTNFETLDNFANNVECIVGEEGLNVLFNNAGYSPKSTRINFVNAQQLTETFAINTVAPILLTKALLPLLKKASSLNGDKPMSSQKAAVINMSSILASLSLNTDGAMYPYRCSKAAVNMATKTLSIDLKNDGIMVTSVHPGWVKTDMGGGNAPMTVDDSCSSLVNLVRNLNETQNGKFVQWDGKELDW